MTSKKNVSQKSNEIDWNVFNELFSVDAKNPKELSDMDLRNFFPTAIYSWDFHRTAQLLYKEWERDHKKFYLVFPIVFIVRHGVELALKDAILELDDYNGKGTTIEQNELHKTHNFYKLADFLQKELVASGFGPHERGGINDDEVLDLLRKWQAADPNGVIFRYALTTSGHQQMPKIDVNPEKILDLSNKIIEWLSVIYLWTDPNS